MRVLVLALACAACSPSGLDLAAGPVALEGERPVLCIDAAINTPELYDLSERVWGAQLDCSRDRAIPVGVRDLDGLVGQAWLDTGEIWLDPSAWNGDPALVLAHEIGHFYGFEHTDRPCDVMHDSQPSERCQIVYVGDLAFERQILK